jgi:hypothetical protein
MNARAHQTSQLGGPRTTKKKIPAVRLDDEGVEGRVGKLAMRILRLGLELQAKHSKPMRDGGGVYYRTPTWLKWLFPKAKTSADKRAATKQIERAFRRLRDFELLHDRWGRRIGRGGREQTVYIRTFAPDGFERRVEGERTKLIVAVSEAARSRPRRGGARAGAGRPPKNSNAGTAPPSVERAIKHLRTPSNSNAGSASALSPKLQIVEGLSVVALGSRNSNAGTITKSLTETVRIPRGTKFPTAAGAADLFNSGHPTCDDCFRPLTECDRECSHDHEGDATS